MEKSNWVIYKNPIWSYGEIQLGHMEKSNWVIWRNPIGSYEEIQLGHMKKSNHTIALVCHCDTLRFPCNSNMENAMNINDMIDVNLMGLDDELRRLDEIDSQEAALEYCVEEISDALVNLMPIRVMSGHRVYDLTYTDFSQWCGENGRTDEEALYDFAQQYAEDRLTYMREHG